jgi:hypothetical protein
MAQDVASAVLAHEIAQVGTQAHVCDGRLMIAPFLHREALEQNESLSINDILAESFQVLRKLWQGEIGLQSELADKNMQLRRAVKPTLEIPVRGVLEARNASAAMLNSSTCSSVNLCVHFSGFSR